MDKKKPGEGIDEADSRVRAELARAINRAIERGLTTHRRLVSGGVISNGKLGRLRNAEENVGVDALDALAQGLDVQPWQLLVPGCDLSSPPRLASAPAASLFRPRYSDAGLELLELFEQIKDEDIKERLALRFQRQITAALQGLPTQLSEFEPYERDAVPTPAPPAPSQKQPAKRQAAPSESSKPSPGAKPRRGR